jgi:phosphoribosylformimino-5-aminoimidazole carboxamide ribotide isomerase
MLDHQAVRLIQGDYSQKKVYHDDPVSLAKIFQGSGCDRIHLVDLNGSKEGEFFHAGEVADILKTGFSSVQVGGGIRSYAQVEDIFNNTLRINQDFIITGSLLFKNPDEFKRIAQDFTESIIVSLDVWEREVKIAGWLESTKNHVLHAMENAMQNGINQFLVTQILSDGMLSGPDYTLYGEILERFPNISLVASGGVSSVSDLKELEERFPSLKGAIIGKAFYEGKIKLTDLNKKE